MSPLLLGLIVLVLLVAVGRGYVRADPKKLARQLRYGGGGLAVALGIGLSIIGREVIGVPLMVIGLGLLGRNALPGLGWFGGQSGGSASRMRSAAVEIDIDSRGHVVAGRFAGRDLASLSADEVGRLLGELATADPRGSGLLEAYLDRRRPGWR